MLNSHLYEIFFFPRWIVISSVVIVLCLSSVPIIRYFPFTVELFVEWHSQGFSGKAGIYKGLGGCCIILPLCRYFFKQFRSNVSITFYLILNTFFNLAIAVVSVQNIIQNHDLWHWREVHAVFTVSSKQIY